jgi:hypothetical protein
VSCSCSEYMVSGGLYQVKLKRLSCNCERLTKLRQPFTLCVLRLANITNGTRRALTLAVVPVAVVIKSTEEGVYERESSMPSFRH